MGWLCRCPGVVWESIWKRAHTPLVGEHFGLSRLCSLSHCGLILTWRVKLVCASWTPLKKKKSAGREWNAEHSPKKPPPPEPVSLHHLPVSTLESVWRQIWTYLTTSPVQTCGTVWRQIENGMKILRTSVKVWNWMTSDLTYLILTIPHTCTCVWNCQIPHTCIYV